MLIRKCARVTKTILRRKKKKKTDHAKRSRSTISSHFFPKLEPVPSPWVLRGFSRGAIADGLIYHYHYHITVHVPINEVDPGTSTSREPRLDPMIFFLFGRSNDPRTTKGVKAKKSKCIEKISVSSVAIFKSKKMAYLSIRQRKITRSILTQTQKSHSLPSDSLQYHSIPYDRFGVYPSTSGNEYREHDLDVVFNPES